MEPICSLPSVKALRGSFAEAGSSLHHFSPQRTQWKVCFLGVADRVLVLIGSKGPMMNGASEPLVLVEPSAGVEQPPNRGCQSVNCWTYGAHDLPPAYLRAQCPPLAPALTLPLPETRRPAQHPNGLRAAHAGDRRIPRRLHRCHRDEYGPRLRPQCAHNAR